MNMQSRGTTRLARELQVYDVVSGLRAFGFYGVSGSRLYILAEILYNCVTPPREHHASQLSTTEMSAPVAAGVSTGPATTGTVPPVTTGTRTTARTTATGNPVSPTSDVILYFLAM